MARKVNEGIKALVKRNQERQAEKPIEQFFRLRDVTVKEDHFPAFQVEMVTVQGQRMLKREFITKRDLKQMGLVKLEEILEEGIYRPDAG